MSDNLQLLALKKHLLLEVLLSSWFYSKNHALLEAIFSRSMLDVPFDGLVLERNVERILQRKRPFESLSSRKFRSIELFPTCAAVFVSLQLATSIEYLDRRAEFDEHLSLKSLDFKEKQVQAPSYLGQQHLIWSMIRVNTIVNAIVVCA